MAIDRDGEGPQLRKAETKADDPNALRATPFTEDVFDEDYYRGRGRATGGSPLGLIFGVVVGAAVAGGAAWFVLKDQGMSGLGGAGGVPVVKADTQPYKIKPENPGGMQVDNQDKTVYDRVAKSDAPNRVENLLPPPEQPKTPPKVEPKPVVPPKGEIADPAPAAKSPLDEKRDELAAMITALEQKNETQAKSTAEAKAALDEPAKPTPLVPAATPTPAAPPAAATPTTAAPPTAPKRDLTPEEITAQLAAAPSPSPAAATTPAAPAPAQAAAVPVAGGSFQVQLAAAKTEEAALAEWTRIKNRHPDLLGALTPNVLRADLGERGVFFRLRAGMLADKTASDALCAALTAQGDACLVIKP